MRSIRHYLKKQTLVRLFKAYLKQKIGRPDPLILVWDITYFCNLKCYFCDLEEVHRDRMNKQLSLEQAKKVIDHVAEADVLFISITGGEPLLRKDLEDIAEYARDKGLLPALATNGTLMTKDRAKRIAKAFHNVTMSLDGFEETHDKIRGVPGTYRRTLKGLKNLINRQGSMVGVNFVINEHNYNEFLGVFNMVRRMGIDYFYYSPVRGFGESIFRFGTNKENVSMGCSGFTYRIPEEHLDRLMNQIIAIKTQYPNLVYPTWHFINQTPAHIYGEKLEKICDGGTLYLAINNEGNLCLCPGLLRAPETYVGSLVEETLPSLLNSEKLQMLKESIIPKCPACMAHCTTEVSIRSKWSVKRIVNSVLK